MTDPEDPRMRFRVWIAARLANEAWVDSSEPDAEREMDRVRRHHAQLVEHATRLDLPWLVEIYDPAKPEHEAYWRFGDDAEGMVDPRPWSP